MIWYVENYRRNRREREALEALASSVDWLAPVGWRIDGSLRLTWDADIAVAGRTFPISLIYPNHFPYSPPMVLPRGVDERWSSHQYGPGGELCLQYGPDNWHQDITGADMILSAHRLLQGETAPPNGGEVASRHKTTLGQDLRGESDRFIVTCAVSELIKGMADGSMVTGTVVTMFHKETFVYVVASVVDPQGEKWVETALPSCLLFEGYERPAVLIRWPASTPTPSVESVTTLKAGLASAGFVLPAVKHVILVQGSFLEAYLLHEKDDTVTELSIIPPQPAADRLDESHSALRGRKVSVVGCGSLGSKVAVMLARSGVGKFLLVDDDILLPDNFVRHDLDWRDAGTHKVDGVARRIELVNSAAKCEKRRHRLGGQESSGSIETLIEKLSDSDLIVDCTADPSVFNYLCAAVAVARKPLVWAEIFGGGFGGLIARYRPHLEPDPASMRRAIENWCQDRGKPIGRAAADYGGTTASPLIADDGDVTAIAAHACRMAIDTLIPREPSAFPYSVYLIGLAKGWIFEGPFDTYPIDVGPPNVSETEQPLDVIEAAEELARISQLFSEYKDADSPHAPDSQTPSS